MKPAVLPENEKERIRKLNELGILDTFEEQAYDDLTYLAAKICNTPIALVSLVDNDRQWFKSHYCLDVRETPRDVAFCSHAILDKNVFIVEDSSKDERFYDNPLVINDPNVKFYAGAPLLMNDNIRLGTLCVIGNKPGVISPEQQKSLEALARQVVSQLELRLKVKELEVLDKTKDEFISMVSHELRTPLTSIAGSLTLLLNNQVGQLDNDQHKLIEIASRNSGRLITIVNEILDQAKIEAGQFEIIKKPHSILSLLKKAIELNNPYCTKCNCELDLDYEQLDIDKTVLCDEDRLIQVLTNLISNAAKASYDGGVVEVSLTCDDNSARIAVTDHGVGIQKNQQHLVFQRFKQIGESVNEKMSGTGLGLNFSKHIIELHGGRIDFNSVPNNHTTFYFILDLVK